MSVVYTVICSDGTSSYTDLPPQILQSAVLSNMKKYNEGTSYSITLDTSMTTWTCLEALLYKGIVPDTLTDLQALWRLVDYFFISITPALFQFYKGKGSLAAGMYSKVGISASLHAAVLLDISQVNYTYLRTFYLNLFSVIKERDLETIEGLYMEIRHMNLQFSSIIISDFLIRVEMLKAQSKRDVDFTRYYHELTGNETVFFKEKLIEKAGPWQWLERMDTLPNNVYIVGEAVVHCLNSINAEKEGREDSWGDEDCLDVWIVGKDFTEVYTTLQTTLEIFTKGERFLIIKTLDDTVLYAAGAVIKLSTKVGSIFETVQQLDVPFVRSLYHPRSSTLWLSEHTMMAATTNEAVIENVDVCELYKYLRVPYEYVNGDIETHTRRLMKPYRSTTQDLINNQSRSEILELHRAEFQRFKRNTKGRVNAGGNGYVIDSANEELKKELNALHLYYSSHSTAENDEKRGIKWFHWVHDDFDPAAFVATKLLAFLDGLPHLAGSSGGNPQPKRNVDSNNQTRWLRTLDFFSENDGDPDFITEMKIQGMHCRAIAGGDNSNFTCKAVLDTKMTIVVRNGETILAGDASNPDPYRYWPAVVYDVTSNQLKCLDRFMSIVLDMRTILAPNTLENVLLARNRFLIRKSPSGSSIIVDYNKASRVVRASGILADIVDFRPLEAHAIDIYGYSDLGGYDVQISNMSVWCSDNIDWMGI